MLSKQQRKQQTQRDNETTTAADTSIYDHEFVLLTLLKFFSDKLLFLFRVLTFERFMVFLCVCVSVVLFLLL